MGAWRAEGEGSPGKLSQGLSLEKGGVVLLRRLGRRSGLIRKKYCGQWGVTGSCGRSWRELRW